MSNDHLHTLRSYELAKALALFPAHRGRGRVLDIGAGTGYQSVLLQSHGYDPIAVDLPASDYVNGRVFPIIDYDGRTLPLSDNSVEVVFSSNVLEHVPNLQGLLEESARVLSEGGVAIHVLPTPAWRCWTTVAYYPWVLSKIWQLFAQNTRRSTAAGPRRTSGTRWWSSLFPRRHGERGNTLSEPYYYSAWWWRRTFAQNGFEIVGCHPTGLFYTGCNLLGDRLPIPIRLCLSRWLGSACRIYVLRPLQGSTMKGGAP